MSALQTVSLLDDDFVAFLAGTYYVVEANPFEYSALYKNYATSQGYPWIENLSGRGATVGYIGDRPIAISLRSAVVHGRKILFCDPTSVLIDWAMIEEWLQANLPTSAKRAAGDFRKTDSNNFYSALHAN